MSNSRKKGPPISTVERLVDAIGQATRSAKFLVAGRLPAVDPGLEIAGVGQVQIPLKRGGAKSLIASAQLAPYGKGTRTFVDTKVRNTYELDAERFSLADEWNAAIAEATRKVADQFGLPAGQLEARLYKLLVYEKGGFFLPHRDSEKHDRMVASLIVVLPNPFEGGRLIVRHGAAKERLDFEDAAAGKLPCFAAFYADCEHEVERVASGVRVALAYNLVLKPQPRKKPDFPPTPTDALTEAMGSWVAPQPTEPLVFALDHHYTQRGLAIDLLKGADRQLANLVMPAAAKADCLVHLAQVTRHLMNDAHEDYDSYRNYYDDEDEDEDEDPIDSKSDDFEIGEVIEEELFGNEWVNLDGKPQSWGTIAFDPSAIVSSVPIDDWKPTSEEYEGYTGNAGNTLDRWYHRSALVIWHRDHHFEILAEAGLAASVPLFHSMVEKLAKTPKKRLEAAQGDCIRFARAIAAQWPQRSTGYGHYQNQNPTDSPLDVFPKLLLKLHDRETIAAFLAVVAERDETHPLKSLIVAAGREHGWTAFSGELKKLLATPPDDRNPRQLLPRDAEWLSAFCGEPSTDADHTQLAGELCAIAVERFCQPPPPRPTYYFPRDRREISVAEKSLPFLLQALAASGRHEDLSRVLRFVRESPDDFGLDDCQVPALQKLIPWSQKRFGSIPPPLADWLAGVRERLESATARRPTVPADWARPVEVPCACGYCTKLKTFLADPATATVVIPAREDLRRHLVGEIERYQCDVKHTLSRTGSPYSLVLTKTIGSYERAVERFEKDRSLLSALPATS